MTKCFTCSWHHITRSVVPHIWYMHIVCISTLYGEDDIHYILQVCTFLFIRVNPRDVDRVSATARVFSGWRIHYNDVEMSGMAFPITSLTIVYSTVYSSADQRQHQCSASLAFIRGIHRWPVNSQHKGQVTRKMFPFDNNDNDNENMFITIDLHIHRIQDARYQYTENKHLTLFFLW